MVAWSRYIGPCFLWMLSLDAFWSRCWLLALFVDFVLPLPPNKQSSQLIACQVLFETISTRALLEDARPIRRQGKTNSAVQLSSEQNEALPGPARGTARSKSAIVLSQENLQDHTAPNCAPGDTPTIHTYKSHIYLHPAQPHFLIHPVPSPSPRRWDLVVFFEGGRKDCHKWTEWLRRSHPPFLQSAADWARQTHACLAAKALNMPQQSDWVLKAGLHFNIQCTNSLTFYSSLQ